MQEKDKKNEGSKETGSEAQKTNPGFHPPTTIALTYLLTYILKLNELICQGTYLRDGNKIFIGDGITLIKRGLDLLIHLKYSNTTKHIARLHKTKTKKVYLFVCCNNVFRIDLSLEITALVKIAHTNNIVQFFSSGKNEEVWGCEDDYTR